MLIKLVLLLISLHLSLAGECQTPLIQTLPKVRFSATSSYNDTVNAPNVRFTTEAPWCPATNEDKDYEKENVKVDLGCPRSVCAVEGKDPRLLFYAGEYSNDNENWEILASDDTTYYVPALKMFRAHNTAVITPPVTARFFRFRAPLYTHSQPCLKVELYGESDSKDSTEPMGCFFEKLPKKKNVRVLPVVYHTVDIDINRKYPDILAIYEECRQRAEEHSEPLEIFGILNYKQCVTTKSGNEEDYFNKASKLRGRACKVCSGKGIGAKRTAVFVYKRHL